MSKQTARIDKWVKTPNGSALVGMVSCHPRQDEFEAKLQITSPLVKFNEKEGVAETMNTIYTLGDKA